MEQFPVKYYKNKNKKYKIKWKIIFFKNGKCIMYVAYLLFMAKINKLHTLVVLSILLLLIKRKYWVLALNISVGYYISIILMLFFINNH